MLKIFMYAALVFLPLGILTAQSQTLTIDQAVEMAISQNLSIMQSNIELRDSKLSLDSAWNNFLPSLSAYGRLNGRSRVFITPSEPNPFSQVSNSLSDPGALTFTAGLDLTLQFNSAVVPGIQNRRSDYEASKLSYEDAKRRLERDVRKQFYLLLANRRNIDVQEANIELSRKRLERVQSNFETGLASEIDVLSAEVSVFNLLSAYNEILELNERQLLYFKFLLGTDQDTEIILDGSLDVGFVDLAIDHEDFLERRLDIQILDQQIRSLKLSKLSLGLTSNSPTLSVGYFYSIFADNDDSGSTDPWSSWNDNNNLSLELRWKLDGFIPNSSTSVQLKSMQNSIGSLEIARRAAYQNARIEIINLINTLESAEKSIEANLAGVDLSRRQFELTEEAYRLGTREILDVETAQNDYLASRQQLLLARYNYIAALLDLEYALNTSVEEWLDS